MRSAGKAMALVVCDANIILLVDYLEIVHIITGANYTDLLRQLH